MLTGNIKEKHTFATLKFVNGFMKLCKIMSRSLISINGLFLISIMHTYFDKCMISMFF